MSQIRVFIVEDQPNILKAQTKLINNISGISVIGSAESGEEALENLENAKILPNIILCDLGLPYMSGVDVTRAVRQKYPSIEIIMFTVFDEENYVLEAIRAGASGYILKGTDTQKIAQALRDVYEGGTVIQPALARMLLKYFQPQKTTNIEDFIDEESLRCDPSNENRRSLTPRELECLQMVAKGLSNGETAHVLGLSKATIRTHLEHIYQKLDVSNRVEAVTEGIRQGIIDL